MKVTECNGSSLGLLFRQVRDAMWMRMERELAAAGHDLNFSQYITLKSLAHGPAGVTELARIAYLHPGAMTRLLDKLEERGLVARTAVPGDRRALLVQLTDAGQVLWAEISPSAQRIHDRAMANLSAEEQQELTRLLMQVRDNLAAED